MNNKKIKIIEYTFLLIMLAINFVLYNYINLTSHNWPINTMELEAYNISKRIIKRLPVIETIEPLIPNQDNTIFANSGVATINNTKTVPRSAIGYFFIIAIGHLMGDEGVFYVSSTLSLFGLLFFYLLSKEYFGFITACIATILFSLSYNFIQWSNILNSNMVGLSSFIAFMYFTTIYLKHKKNYNLFLSCLFYALTIWVRYEYILFAPFIIFFFLKQISVKKIFKYFLIFILFITPIFYNNYRIYGNMFSTGYTLSNSVERQGYNYLTEKYPQFIRDHKIFLTIIRFTSLIGNYDIKRIIVNTKNIIPLIGIPILITSLIGFVVIMFNKLYIQTKKYFLLLFVYMILFYLYFGDGYYTDMYVGWLASVVSRYILPMFFFIFLFSCGLIAKIVRSQKRKFYLLFFFPLFFFSFNTTVNNIQYGHFGLNDIRQRKQHAYNISQAIALLPNNSVIISSTYAYRNVIDKKFINTDIVDNKKYNKIKKINEYIEYLILENYQIYIVEDSKDSNNYLNLSDKLPKTSYKTSAIKQVDYDTIYAVSRI